MILFPHFIYKNSWVIQFSNFLMQPFHEATWVLHVDPSKQTNWGEIKEGSVIMGELCPPPKNSFNKFAIVHYSKTRLDKNSLSIYPPFMVADSKASSAILFTDLRASVIEFAGLRHTTSQQNDLSIAYNKKNILRFFLILIEKCNVINFFISKAYFVQNGFAGLRQQRLRTSGTKLLHISNFPRPTNLLSQRSLAGLNAEPQSSGSSRAATGAIDSAKRQFPVPVRWPALPCETTLASPSTESTSSSSPGSSRPATPSTRANESGFANEQRQGMAWLCRVAKRQGPTETNKTNLRLCRNKDVAGEVSRTFVIILQFIELKLNRIVRYVKSKITSLRGTGLSVSFLQIFFVPYIILFGCFFTYFAFSIILPASASSGALLAGSALPGVASIAEFAYPAFSAFGNFASFAGVDRVSSAMPTNVAGLERQMGRFAATTPYLGDLMTTSMLQVNDNARAEISSLSLFLYQLGSIPRIGFRFGNYSTASPMLCGLNLRDWQGSVFVNPLVALFSVAWRAGTGIFSHINSNLGSVAASAIGSISEPAWHGRAGLNSAASDCWINPRIAELASSFIEFLQQWSVEFLRFANYSSKLFVVWGILNIWKGIRPGQSTKNEYSMNTRIFFKNKKRFKDLEGIEKFLPVLETCVKKLKATSGWFRFCPDFIQLASVGLAASRHGTNKEINYPKGYLFIGPPGTGKTLLGRAVAGEAGVPFIGLSASEIQKQIDIGTRIGAIRLRNLFFKAKQYTPCILFFDEIDSIGRMTTRQSSGMDETEYTFESSGAPYEPTMFGFAGSPSVPFAVTDRNVVGVDGGAHTITSNSNTLLSPTESRIAGPLDRATPLQGNNGQANHDITLFTEFLIQMDSVKTDEGLIIIGTTNFFANLDSAFIRSGRFDRIIGLQYPGKQTRINLFKLYTKKHGCDFSSVLSNLTESNSTQAGLAPSPDSLSRVNGVARSRSEKGLMPGERAESVLPSLRTPWPSEALPYHSDSMQASHGKISVAAPSMAEPKGPEQTKTTPSKRRHGETQENVSAFVKEADTTNFLWLKLAEKTKGFTAADLAKVVNESLLFNLFIWHSFTLQVRAVRQEKTGLANDIISEINSTTRSSSLAANGEAYAMRDYVGSALYRVDQFAKRTTTRLRRKEQSEQVRHTYFSLEKGIEKISSRDVFIGGPAKRNM